MADSFVKRFKEPGGYYDQANVLGIAAAAARLREAPSHPKMLLGGAAVGGVAGGLLGYAVSSKIAKRRKGILEAMHKNLSIPEKLGLTSGGRAKKKAIKKAFETMGRKGRMALEVGAGGALLGGLLAHGFNSAWRVSRKAQEAQGIHKHAGFLSSTGDAITGMLSGKAPRLAGFLGQEIGGAVPGVTGMAQTAVKSFKPVAKAIEPSMARSIFPQRAISGGGPFSVGPNPGSAVKGFR